MTSRIATGITAREAMRPLPGWVTVDDTAARARSRLRENDLDLVVVVAPDTHKLVGGVLRGPLERACVSNGHDPEKCPIVQHLIPDVDFCFEGERVEEVLNSSMAGEFASPRTRRLRRARRKLPVIVVDDQKIPIGLLDRGGA